MSLAATVHNNRKVRIHPLRRGEFKDLDQQMSPLNRSALRLQRNPSRAITAPLTELEELSETWGTWILLSLRLHIDRVGIKRIFRYDKRFDFKAV